MRDMTEESKSEVRSNRLERKRDLNAGVRLGRWEDQGGDTYPARILGFLGGREEARHM